MDAHRFSETASHNAGCVSCYLVHVKFCSTSEHKVCGANLPLTQRKYGTDGAAVLLASDFSVFPQSCARPDANAATIVQAHTAGGGTNPPSACSTSCANRRQVRSSR
jgi:hypothetical protein